MILESPPCPASCATVLRAPSSVKIFITSRVTPQGAPPSAAATSARPSCRSAADPQRRKARLDRALSSDTIRSLITAFGTRHWRTSTSQAPLRQDHHGGRRRRQPAHCHAAADPLPACVPHRGGHLHCSTCCTASSGPTPSMNSPTPTRARQVLAAGAARTAACPRKVASSALRASAKW